MSAPQTHDLDPLYIYAGFSQGSHLVVHMQLRPRPDEEAAAACCQVFNALIHDRRVARGDRLLAFVFRRQGGVLPVSVTHASFIAIKYPPGALPLILARLGQQPFEGERLVLKETTQEDGRTAFLLFIIPASAASFPEMDVAHLTFAPLVEIATTKPIPYL